MRRTLIAFFAVFMAQMSNAAPLSQEQLRDLVLDRKIHQLEDEMARAQDAFKAGETDADHLRDLNMVFVTTSPKIREVAEEWLSRYPTSHYAMMANAWISNEVAWTIRGTRYASQVYREAWPAFRVATEKSANLTMQAYEQDPSYLPTTDGLINHAISGSLDLDPALLVHTVMADMPNAGTLIRGLRAAQKGWGGSYTDGETMCAIHARKVPQWGDQAYDICMIHLAFKYTGWQPMEAFADRLLRTDHPAILDIRRKVISKSNFYIPGWYETVSQLEFPKEEWREDLIALVNSEGFSDLELAIDYDSRFANYTDLEMVIDKVRPHARAEAEEVLAYDPYNIAAIETLLNHESFETKEDGHRGYKLIDGLNSMKQHIDLNKRLVMAQPWDAVGWKKLSLFIPHIPRSHHELMARRDIAMNYIAYSNHSPIRLRDFIETNRNLIDSHERALDGKGIKGQEWLLDVEPVTTLYCPVARAILLFDHACNAKVSPQQRNACESPIYQIEKLEKVVEDMTKSPDCVFSSSQEFSDLMFTPVEIDVMSLELN